MANLLSRVLAPFRSSPPLVEKQGPYWLPFSGGWLSADAGSVWNWWQLGNNITSACTSSAIVEACVSAYAQTVAMCPGNHWLLNSKGGRDRVETSALTRILRKPNSYQSISDFLLNLTRSLYIDGNAYALALRNSRFEITELHLMNPRASSPRLVLDKAENEVEVFYSLGGNDIIDLLRGTGDPPLIVPARDVLHIRLHTPRCTLRGESPLVAAAYNVAASGAMTQQQLAFFMNQARPSTVLTTDQTLTEEQAIEIRERWNEQAKGLAAGGTPILTAGLKPMTLATTARDAQLAESMKYTEQQIALAFRVPLQLLGIGETPFASTEALMQFWLATGLNFCLNHIEEAFGQMFGLFGYPDEYLEFDTSALLRSALKDEIEAYTRGVQGGIYSPNEARERFQLPSVKDGDEPRVQSQVVPLSAAGAIPTAPAAPAAPASPTPAATNNQEPKDAGPGSSDEQITADFWADLNELRTHADA